MQANNREERVPLWTVSKQWRRQFLALFSTMASIMTALIIWHETWARDSDTLLETILAVTNEASVGYLAIAVGTAVFVDVLTFGKTVFQNAKRVIDLISEILKDAIQRQKERHKAETERREREERLREEVSQLRQENSELEGTQVLRLKQRVKELEEELQRRPSSS